MVVYTWWCWHICKGEVVGEEKEEKQGLDSADGQDLTLPRWVWSLTLASGVASESFGPCGLQSSRRR
jgi:hypothetical protein